MSSQFKKLVPLLNRVLVKKIEPATKTKSGIILSSKEALANVGEVPLAISPGMRICQIFLHQIEAGAALYVWLSGRNGPDSTAIMSFEYVPGEATQAKPDWVGARTRDETNDACPRHEEVHSSLSLELSVRTRGSQCHPVR